MKKRNKERTGFTIIETSLVLAIAGIILVMVFIALPALQRQQRDTKRKDDTALFIQAIKKYQQNNRGVLPDLSNYTNRTNFYTNYLGDSFKSPEGEEYLISEGNDDIYEGSFEDQEHMFYFSGYKCGEDNKASISSNPRNMTIVIKLETGGVYCANT